MSGLIKALMGAGGAILAILGIFFYGKHSGKKESENKQRKQIIESIEKRHKVDNAVNNMSDADLDDELLDDNTDK